MADIWAHTLVKNECRWLWFAVTSAISHVDKLLLWDTGSTDESLEIEKELVKKYGDKISFKRRGQSSSEDFTNVRQEMLDETKGDWFIVLDGDEIWWRDSIKKVTNFINKSGGKHESVIMPTVNLVGDIFHHQDKSSGKYKFGKRVGHYNLRAIKRNIPGLHSQGIHGVWGWADGKNQMIQNRKTYKFLNTPYLHATNLERSKKDKEVIKRSRKLKYEIGKSFPLDFYYPEALFEDRPGFIKSPWDVMSGEYKFRAFFETPLRRVKRKIWQGSPGY